MTIKTIKTLILDDVTWREKAVSDVINRLSQLTSEKLYRYWSYYRIEHFKIPGLFPCLACHQAQPFHFEIFDPSSDTAYEKAEISLDYYADPNEEVVKPPDADLETLLAYLTTLPDLM